VADHSSELISCVLIPLQEYYLLLPNAAIAEVIPMPKLLPSTSSSSHNLGSYTWQENVIPVINLEGLFSNADITPSNRSKLGIFRTINATSTLPAYALPCLGSPQLIQINESALNVVNQTELSEFIHCQIQIGSKVASIPNLDAIEALIHSTP
jgi:chemosensory pili system protein ChpC